MNNDLSQLKQFITEVENKKTLVLAKLPYQKDELSPVLSQDSLNYHHGKLAKTYVERFNKGEGDPVFNEAGAFLHNIFFPQLKPPSGANRPFDASLKFINKHFKGGLEELKNEFEKTAMGIQGSGWVYLARNGRIKTITNHAVRQDIVLLIDWWEHSWALDYQADKQKYLNNIWRIINWTVINDRLNLK